VNDIVGVLNILKSKRMNGFYAHSINCLDHHVVMYHSWALGSRDEHNWVVDGKHTWVSFSSTH
jgi:hypothetical protein